MPKSLVFLLSLLIIGAFSLFGSIFYFGTHQPTICTNNVAVLVTDLEGHPLDDVAITVAGTERSIYTKDGIAILPMSCNIEEVQKLFATKKGCNPYSQYFNIKDHSFTIRLFPLK